MKKMYRWLTCGTLSWMLGACALGANPQDPMNPTNPTSPTNPTQPTNPTDPSNPTPEDPSGPVGTVDPGPVIQGPMDPPPAVTAADSVDDWLHVQGNQILDSRGYPVWLTGVNYFGFNCTERVFHGLWSGNLEKILDSVAQRGFNLLRVPISTQLVSEWMSGQDRVPNVNEQANPNLKGMTSLQIFETTLAYCKKIGLKVLIDTHSAMADNSGHIYPIWHKDTITTEVFMKAWEWLANRYKQDDTVIAFDLKNEPHGKAHSDPANQVAIWDDSTNADVNWKYAAEQTARRILKVHPNVLILIEGIESYPREGKDFSSRNEADYHFNWWGGNLRGVAKHPVQVGERQAQIMYSPHDYGPAVFEQPWFKKDFNKASLYEDCWLPNWYYIHKERKAPLLIGEWGGRLNEAGNLKWLTALREFIVEHHLHHTFWCLNPNSGDTGGLLSSDDGTWDNEKYSFVKPTLWTDQSQKFVSLDHRRPLGNATTGVSLQQYYEQRNLPPAP